ncbi:MAG: C25 family cysteine peptidase, partial [candidate division WOR-3 bacterium]
MRFTVLILLTVFAGAGLGSPHLSWVSQAAGLDIRLSVEEVAIDSVQVEGRGFATVNLPEAGFTLEIGKPLVPVYYRLVEVPFGAELSIEASCEEVEERSLGLPLLPRQEPVPKSGPRPSFVMDEKVYRADEFSPDIGARILEIGEIRGHRVATVEIRPVSYNPVKGVLRFSRKMVVKVRWAGADWERTRVMHRRYDSPAYQGRLRGIVLNAESFEEDMVPPLPIGLLIIVPDEWQANVQPLADWYRRKGFHVFVRNLTQVGGGQANTVKDYIQDAYDHWPVPPDFVLLVGDVDRIGYFTGQGQGNPPTDLNFSLVAGSDYFPDIDVSRLSVATASQLDSLVVKTVNYQKNIWSNGTQWCRKAYFIASSDGGNHQVAEGTHLYCMRKIRPMGVVCDSLWLYYGTGTPITTALNTGRAWVTYSGHGGENCWADPSPDFDIGAVHALANTDMVPFVQTYACLSGNFASTSYPECFSEAWIRNGFRGGIAHLASTVTSYWTEDDTLQRRVYDYMFDSLWTWIMGGVNRAKLKYYIQMGNSSTTRRYFEMYNLMGDGAVDPYWQEPQPLTVTHPPVIPIGSYQLRVLVEASGRPVENALVGITAKNDSLVFASDWTNSSGEAMLEVTTTQPDSIFITVTGHNLAPYLGAAMALPPSGPYVMFLRHLVDDSAGGNNDHIINPGETINLPIWMKNWGNETAQNVQVWFSTTDTNIALIDTVKSFGSIMAQDSAWTGPDGFRFAVAPSCTNGYNLRFTLTARDANDSVWTSFLTLSVGAPVLQFVSCRAIDSPPGGNGNGMIEPGEVGDVIVTLRNIGLGNGYDVTGVLRSGDARLLVLDSMASFGIILRDTTGSNEADRFQVRADAS